MAGLTLLDCVTLALGRATCFLALGRNEAMSTVTINGIERLIEPHANLSRANLSRANLSGARGIVDAGQRSDGYRFTAWAHNGVLQIRAGCRSLSISEARDHWTRTRGYTPLGQETMLRLDLLETLAKLHGLIEG